MRDLCRLIGWMVVDLIRSRVMLEAEIWTLRQQINVLRRTAPKKLSFCAVDRMTGRRFPPLCRWAQAELPSISLVRIFAQSGGLISYGPDFPAVARLGAHYVDRILKGAKPADLPIEQPSKYQLVINLKTARSLGVEVPASLLARADEVIE